MISTCPLLAKPVLKSALACICILSLVACEKPKAVDGLASALNSKGDAWKKQNCGPSVVTRKMPNSPLPLGVLKVHAFANASLSLDSNAAWLFYESAQNATGLVLKYPDGTLVEPLGLIEPFDPADDVIA